MGDRVSIQFMNGQEKSVVLFSHWGGMAFVEQAKRYIKILKAENTRLEKGPVYPLSRMEPNTVIVDFIRSITAHQDRVNSDLYLEASEEDGDNSDNGHWVIDLATDTYTHYAG